jgi:DNA-binding Lrp family transcriptional regulator
VRTARLAVETTAADELVREAILQAEEEARLIVQDARERIGAVGARTRELLEQSLGVTPQAPARARRQPVRTASSVEERAYAGAVMVEAGPFDDVTQLKAFEDALASIPGVVEAYIRTFERFYAHFALSIDEPTPLIAELRARTEELLRVIDAGGEDLRLEIVRAGDATSSP